ncbi:MAG: multidrug effflux MFS transporter [Legionellaceae bacterium]|nr:multidrug effflux MFS transporter [Legionellaceae bacterium]
MIVYYYDILNAMKHKTPTPLLYLGMLACFSLLTFDLFQPALPAMTADFDTSQSISQLTLSLYLFSYGVSQLFWGPILDHYGRHKPLYLSLGIFLFATLCCIYASNIMVLIAGRMLQGFSVCCANNIAFSSTRDIANNTARAKTISHISMIISVSPIFAPVIGSYIFIHSNWQMIFWTMFAIALLIAALIKPLLRESPNWRVPARRLRFSHSLRRYSYLFDKRSIWRALVITTASFSTVMIFVINASFLLIDDMGFSPTVFAYLFACIGFNIILANYIGIKLRDIKPLNWNIRLGSSLMLLGSLLIFLLLNTIGLQLLTISPILVVSLGTCLTNPPALSMALNDFPRLSSSTTALINTTRTIVSSIVAAGVSLFYVLHPNVLPLALLVCSLISMLAAVYLYPLSEDENSDRNSR